MAVPDLHPGQPSPWVPDSRRSGSGHGDPQCPQGPGHLDLQAAVQRRLNGGQIVVTQQQAHRLPWHDLVRSKNPAAQAADKNRRATSKAALVRGC